MAMPPPLHRVQHIVSLSKPCAGVTIWSDSAHMGLGHTTPEHRTGSEFGLGPIPPVSPSGDSYGNTMEGSSVLHTGQQVPASLGMTVLNGAWQFTLPHLMYVHRGSSLGV
eukprot:CAMPEP_0204270176 /NCGR_PEP_ID=MMETSP0468-20130131/18406_1 /ASSEMBLY_ACC=CAM_ASM_000383 /TAXON_ID=2969 /ORGANISM="Oxyrrhis marina" /LENGTH=109 /DNA_ID=CAMNT_0051245675 /DNA_START=80 /DNA_END=409 /DNA_ORIENTATION=-